MAACWAVKPTAVPAQEASCVTAASGTILCREGKDIVAYSLGFLWGRHCNDYHDAENTTYYWP